MSIVNEIRRIYEDDPERKAGTGWPSGSRLGTCQAQMELLRYPDISTPEPPRARMLMTWHRGRRVEQWLGEKMYEAWGGAVGLAQEPFYFLVDIDDDAAMFELVTKGLAANEARALDHHRDFWGVLRDGFKPPTMRIGEDGRIKLRLLADKKLGFVVDRTAGGVWIPTYIDYAINHPDFGLCVVETKSMSNYAFRRAVLGDLDYGKRAQLVGIKRATGANVVLVAERAETQHLAEIAYTDTADRVRVTLTKQNGMQEVYFTTPDRQSLMTVGTESIPGADWATLPEGKIVDFPPDVDWETAETWTPMDEGLWEQIKRRVLGVLLAPAPTGRDVMLPSGSYRLLEGITREYGPSFLCSVCDGTGIQTRRKGSAVPLKEPKPCGDCVGGIRDEVDIPNFPCGYCSVVSACVPFARLEIDERPHWRVTRADWEASGLTFTTPEGAR